MTQQESEELLELSSDTRGILEEHDPRPLWEVEDDVGYVLDDPDSDIQKQEDIQTAINAIEENTPIADLPPGFQRRIAVPISTANAILNTTYIGIQTVSPGGTTPSHRHGTNAFRLTIDGHEGMKTAIAGEEFPMKDNSLVTTLQWEWHNHMDNGGETAAWLDILDLPFVLDSLNAKNTLEYHELDCQPVTRTPRYWESQCGRTRDCGETKRDGIPGPFKGKCGATLPYRSGWDDTLEALHQYADNDTPDPHDSYSFLHVNPVSGKLSLFPTISLRAQLLQERTDPHFHNMAEVHFVVRGESATHIGGKALEQSWWGMSVAASDETHHHDPDDKAILLGITNRSVFEMFNLCAETAPQ